MGASVTIFTTAYCPYCVMAKRLLTTKGVTYDEVDVGDRPDLRAWLVEVSQQRTVPQVFINGVPVGGFSDITALDGKGELAALLSRDPSASDQAVRR